MTKKFGFAVAILLAVALIGFGSYSVAGDGTQKSTDAVKTAEKTNKAGCSATCSSSAKSSSASKSGGCGMSGAKSAGAAKSGACCASGAKNAGMTQSDVKSAGASKSSGCGMSGAKSAGASKAGCSPTCSSSAKNASATKSSGCGMAGAKNAGAKMTKAGCSSKCSSSAKHASYDANVYKVENGTRYAVADGKRFVVSEKTPYTQVGNARYYFADESCAVGCQTKMANLKDKYNREALALTVTEANVKNIDGTRYGVCKNSGKEFEISNATPARVIDGQKVYFCGESCAENCSSRNSL